MIQTSCPICRRKMEGRGLEDLPYLPFCSLKCKRIDLGRWLDEAYRLPAEESEEDSLPEEKEVP